MGRLSGRNIDGTIIPNLSTVVFDEATQSLQFPGGANGTAYVQLNTAGDPFKDFTSGLTIEFEAGFGATRSAWERIFDFAAAVNSTGDAFWVGHYETTNELALEVWRSGVNQGRCHTSTGGEALGALGDRLFAKWTITLGAENGTVKCRIYKDGVALPTQVSDSAAGLDSSATTTGSVYALPRDVSRPSAFFGRSNWSGDGDFEGRLRYIRLYERALTQEQVQQNAQGSSSSEVLASGGRSSADDDTCVSGIFLTVRGESGDAVSDSPVTFGACALRPQTAYSLRLVSANGLTRGNQVLDSGFVRPSGALEQTIDLPQLAPGVYNIMLTSVHPSGYPLKLTNTVEIGADNKYVSVSEERLQPYLH